MTTKTRESMFKDDEVGAPLKQSLFRRVWLANLTSNFGSLIQGVGAAWAMTQMAASPDMVALVQTAVMLPVMLISIPAGAIADMYDRRMVGLVSLAATFVCSVALCAVAWFGLLDPVNLLVFCFLIGSGMALYGPAWQASVNEQVPPKMLPAAISLNSISFNIARSFGPAIGGVIVAAFGAVAAFIANAFSYIPVLVVLYFWRRKQEPSRLPPERLSRAIISGVRYVVHSPPMRTVMLRCTITGALGGSIFALLPLLVRDVLGGGAQSYGVMLGAFGIGAIVGAFFVTDIRKKLGSEAAVSAALLAMGIGTTVASLSRSPALTALALALAGGGWMMSMALFNISIQMAAPRWVSGRALAGFRTSNSAGLAVGSWAWGALAVHIGIDKALLVSALAMLVSPLVCVRPAHAGGGRRQPGGDAHGGRSGGAARTDAAQRAGRGRDRVPHPDVTGARVPRHHAGGAAQPATQRRLWLVDRPRPDQSRTVDRALPLPDLARLSAPAQPADRRRARAAEDGDRHAYRPEPVRIRRMLERPFGSVRWKEDTPDVASSDVIPMAAQTASTSGT